MEKVYRQEFTSRLWTVEKMPIKTRLIHFFTLGKFGQSFTIKLTEQKKVLLCLGAPQPQALIFKPIVMPNINCRCSMSKIKGDE